MEVAAGPLSRTMPMPPRPGGVEIAAIVSVSRGISLMYWKQCRSPGQISLESRKQLPKPFSKWQTYIMKRKSILI
jgi:hypothetical protein